LIKMAAFAEIERQATKEDKIFLSIKYQILCDDTAIIGVLNQLNRNTGEMKRATINFDKEEFSAGLEIEQRRTKGGTRGHSGVITDPTEFCKEVLTENFRKYQERAMEIPAERFDKVNAMIFEGVPVPTKGVWTNRAFPEMWFANF